MDITLKGLANATYWRLHCRAVEHGVSINDEILATLGAGSKDTPPDPEARLAAARRIRAEISGRRIS
jgi:plasmid stability protein